MIKHLWRDGIFQLDKSVSNISDMPSGLTISQNSAEQDYEIMVAENHSIVEPLVLWFSDLQLTKPLTLTLTLGKNAQLNLVEIYHDNRCDTEINCLINLGEGAILRQRKCQVDASEGSHQATTYVKQAHGSEWQGVYFSLGARFSQDMIRVSLQGTEARCQIAGLSLPTLQQRLEHHVTIEHAVSSCYSEQQFKSMVDDQATGVFNGKVIVNPGAANTVAHQSSRNLLLSPRATMEAKPELEIYHDDVKCSHGATMGQLDEDALFYLMSRGIPYSEARKLLLQAFVETIFSVMPDDAMTSFCRSSLSKHWETV
jgi:Fe-S cluster assembly protein SufD